MKSTDHFLGDRVSVRCRHLDRAFRSADDDVGAHTWAAGTIIARDALGTDLRTSSSAVARTRYVVQLDDHRRVVAFDDDVRRFTLAFEIYETLEKMAS